MNPLRIALVTRRFWPLVGGAEVVMGNLAVELQRQGAEVVIVTAQWEPQWPSELVHREVRVQRLPNPRQRGWGTFRYMLSLNRWLRAQRQKLDITYVSMLKHDAYTAISALRGSGCSVVLRGEGSGETGDCQWQRTARFGMRIRRRCQTAEALVAPSAKIAQEMQESGYPTDRIHMIPNGVPVRTAVDLNRRIAARAALVDANWDLDVPRGGCVAVYTGRLHVGKGLLELVDAWSLVVEKIPEARLWIVGEGPLRDELYQNIRDRQLHRSAFLPGVFDDVDELLYGADVFILPSHEEGMSVSLLEAMSVGLPCIATDIPGNQALVQGGQYGILVPPKSPVPLASAILDVFRNAQRAADIGRAARQHVVDNFSINHTVRHHVALFERLLQSRGRASITRD